MANRTHRTHRERQDRNARKSARRSQGRLVTTTMLDGREMALRFVPGRATRLLHQRQRAGRSVAWPMTFDSYFPVTQD